MHVIFGVVLPTVIGLAIVFLILFFLVVVVVTIADSIGWPGFIAKYKQKEKEKEEERTKRMDPGEKAGGDIEGLGLLGLGGDGDGEIIDVGDRKRRVEVEIEFLETLLRVKKERLGALQ
jgi:Na+-transporting methylmalonyl-CoA/oxaloacetate decarboxylase gamma subunit